jgi:hypothetical protein
LTVIPNDPDPRVRELNRRKLELGGLHRWRGIVHVDRAPRLPSWTTLEGEGGASVLRQSGKGDEYPSNCTVMLLDTAVGSYDGIVDRDMDDGRDGDWTILGHGTDMGGYQVGRVVWAWRWQSYTGERERYTVRAVLPEERAVLLDGPVPDHFNALKWANGLPVHDVAAGADEVRLVPRGPHKLNPPFTAMIAGGPCFVDECAGEFRTVVAVEGSRVLLDRPLTRSWEKAALILGPWVEHVNIRNLRLDTPTMNLGALPFFSRGCVNLTLEGVTTQHGSPVAGFSTSGYVRVRGCDFPGGIGMGTVHDFEASGSRIGPAAIEEGCSDVTLRDGLSYARQGQHGLHVHTGCERVTLRDYRVEGFGYNGGSPVATDCPGQVLERVEFRNSNPSTAAFLGGDGGRIERLKSDVPVHVTLGQGWAIRQSSAPAWELREGTAGTVRDTDGPVEGGVGWDVDAADDTDGGEDTDSDDED